MTFWIWNRIVMAYIIKIQYHSFVNYFFSHNRQVFKHVLSLVHQKLRLGETFQWTRFRKNVQPTLIITNKTENTFVKKKNLVCHFFRCRNSFHRFSTTRNSTFPWNYYSFRELVNCGVYISAERSGHLTRQKNHIKYKKVHFLWFNSTKPFFKCLCDNLVTLPA